MKYMKKNKENQLQTFLIFMLDILMQISTSYLKKENRK